jgi:hypothetical protein
MPHTPSNPIHKVRITRLRKKPSILLSLALLPLLPLLSLLSLFIPPPFLLLPSLPLGTIIQQKRQRATKRQNNQRLQNIRVNIICIFIVDHGVVVVSIVVVPACKFGFEEGREPFG